MVEEAGSGAVDKRQLLLTENMPTSTDDALKRILEEMSQLPEFVGIPLNSPNAKGNFGNTPLHVAAVRGDTRAAQTLLEAGANPNVCGEHGYTPLHEAVEQENADFVRLLLDYRVQLGVANEDGETARDIARKTGNVAISQILERAQSQSK
jgi:uncharacterized protein